MGESPESRVRLAAALEAVMRGETDLICLLEGVDLYDGALMACLHGLWHFEIDKDIRAKDVWYRSMQEGCMGELIRRLRAGVSDGELSEIDFLARRWER